jgi:hypothetical protein
MDQNTVYQLFVATYHPDPNVHKQAELNIRGVSQQDKNKTLILYLHSFEA